MKISEILKEKNEGVSFEFFPPKSDIGKKSLSATVSVLKEFKPLYMSMTYGAGGGTQERTKDAVELLLQETKIEVMPHLTCIGAHKETISGLLDYYKERKIDNIMALRGDPPCGVDNFSFAQQDFSYAVDLVKTIKINDNFCIGVAVYPEGHIESPGIDQDIEYTKQKIDIGADFAVTQMFFDNKYFYQMLERFHKKGITIPVLPGILPLTDVDKVKQFAAICRSTIPEHIERAMARFAGNPQEMEKVGIDFTIKQCRDLIRNGAKKLHFFTLNKPEIIKTILNAIF
ncbi:MAG: methylenetetrahydrofolate reductase [NAD(P)H] [Candidatus Omnitrophota bacterium]